MKPHPLIRSSAPQSSTQDRGASSYPTECKHCEFCWTRMFGCTSTRCYCHNHPLEAA